MIGQNIGIDPTTAVTGFSGKTNVAIVNAAGQLQQTVSIDFSAHTISVNGAAATGFAPANFVLGAEHRPGVFRIALNGVLSIAATGSGNGVSIGEDYAVGFRQWPGFSQYFGLNNLINSTGITNYQTGLTGADPSGFAAGQSLTLRISNAAGSQITDVQVTTPAGGTVQNLIDSLNSNTNGVGLYGKFALSGAGQLIFVPPAQQPVGGQGHHPKRRRRRVGKPAIRHRQLRAARIDSYSVRSDIAANPSKVAFATLNLGVPSGSPVLALGDGSGAALAAKAATTTMKFDAAGGIAATSTTVNQYAAQLAGALGNQAAAAAQASTNAAAVQTEASSRLASVQGVNLDAELVNLTTYQQAYNASARLVTASQDMFTALLNMVGQ